MIGAWHGGLSFKNQRTGYTITVNFDASPSFQLAIIPHIVRYPNGTADLLWENYGKVFIYIGENDTYWETVMPVASMNGTSYNLFMKWVGKANDSYPFYNLWSVWTNWPGKVLLPNYECFAFVWSAFGQIKTLGGVFRPDAHPRQSFISLYSNSVPVKVDQTNPMMKEALVDFYETLEASIKDMGIIGFFERTLEYCSGWYFLCEKGQ